MNVSERRAWVGIAVVVALLLAVFVVLVVVRAVPLNADSIGSVLLLITVFVNTLLWIEAREERLAQQRPFILVDFDQGGFDVNGTDLPRLNIRNRGAGAAVDVHVAFSPSLKLRSGEDISDNAAIRDGVRFLGPRQTMSINLDTAFALWSYIDAQTPYREGETPPPTRAAKVTVTTRYRGLGMRQVFGEEFELHPSPWVDGWTVATDGGA